ncbi:MAG: HNH endonuclease [Rhodospirillales bacterium]|nr:HNH endonuclease [Alphaproteobacteria bacterium]MBL6947077.1 HNH endonuclease [Rhodospirillales bacterium]
MSISGENFPALVLNADFRPLSYFPLSLWSWQDTVKAVFLSRVNVVSEYDRAVHSPSFELKLPSVISLKDYVHMDRRPAFTRFNVFLRDAFSCQYCARPFPSEILTFDHIVPRSRGGRTMWENVVTACAPCNLKKSHRSLKNAGMQLLRPPVRPSNFLLQENGRAFPPNFLHESWRDFLYWDTELESS